MPRDPGLTPPLDQRLVVAEAQSKSDPIASEPLQAIIPLISPACFHGTIVEVRFFF
jgi:hypothetical protein